MNTVDFQSLEERGRTKAMNTVTMAFEQELESILVKFTKNEDSNGPDSNLTKKVSFSKLFKEFKPRIQPLYYSEKVVQIGSFLYANKAYRVAKFQCFARYLQEIYADFKCVEDFADMEVDKFQEIFFPKGLDDVQSINTIKVLFEDIMCSFNIVKEYDPRLQNLFSVKRCENLLKILRIITQIALKKEEFCWLVYNGTIHIYQISRYMMLATKSKVVLEYLIYAAMCMESAIPLLTLKYLQWRCTLYVAVCLCYFDCKQSRLAESFARRAMKKVVELSDIEAVSTSEVSLQSKVIFQAARVRINAVIFQRTVFELRKRPKGLLRPKAKLAMKDALHLNWPRSQTERLLSDLFEGSSSQFLAIIQTLGDPHRRTLQCRSPSGAIDDTTLDVYPELFVAAVDLISGGNSGTRGARQEAEVHPSCVKLSSLSLIHLSEHGSDGVPLPFVIQFLKLSYSYEQWDVISLLLQPCINMLKTGSGTELLQAPAYLLALHLMAAMEPFCNTGRKPKRVSNNTETTHQEQIPAPKTGSTNIDDILQVANLIHSSSSELPKTALPYLDVDMVIDASLFLWSRCKTFFQRVVSCSMDSCRQVINDPDCDKWLYILLTIHNVLHWTGLSDIDPVMTGDVALKLALVLECRATSLSLGQTSNNSLHVRETKNSTEKLMDKAGSTTKAGDASVGKEPKPHQAFFPSCSRDLLDMAFKILEAGIERINEARDKQEGIFRMSEDEATLNKNSCEAANNESTEKQTETCVQITQLELLYNLTRLLVKLNQQTEDSQLTLNSGKSKTSLSSQQEQSVKEKKKIAPWIEEVTKKYSKNPITKALLLMHKTQHENTDKKVTRQQLQECYDLINKAQKQEKNLVAKFMKKTTEDVVASEMPPPPLLVYRNSTSIILRPAPFKPLTNEKVYWYRVFGCSATGSNIKVRFNDSVLTGTGDEIAVGQDCKFHITNLNESEKYVFAVAAYDRNGKVIGGNVGPTGSPIPASYSLFNSIIWGYLAQVCYTCGVYDIAKNSAQLLWKSFIPCHDTLKDEENTNTDLNFVKCDERLLANSNHGLLRQFLQSIFIIVDVNIHDGKLYCDSLCDYGPLLPGQIKRIKQCEKMSFALKLALWLNDNSLVLQCIVRMYGLVAPVIQFKIPSKPVIKILLYCYGILQEIPALSRFRKGSTTSDCLYHLIAVITYYLIKVLPLWGEEELANTIREQSLKTLAAEPPSDKEGNGEQGNEQQSQATKYTKIIGKKAKFKMGNRRKQLMAARTHIKQDVSKISNFVQSKEYTSLERYHLRINCDAILFQKSELELMGIEDPVVLISYIAGMNLHDSYKEVMKFKKRSKFLEYFVHVIEKAYVEESYELIFEWSLETDNWLIKRSDQLMPLIRPSLVLAQEGGEETRQTKFAAAICEYGKPSPKKSQKMARQVLESLHESRAGQRNEATSTSPKVSLAQQNKFRKDKRKRGKTGEEIHMISAIEALQNKLPGFWKNESRKKKLRTITREELPWKCQWNILRALTNLDVFLKHYENKNKQDNYSTTNQNRATSMGIDWFSFDNTGVIIPRISNTEDTIQNKEFVSTLYQNTFKTDTTKKSLKELLKTEITNPESLKYICNAAKHCLQAVVLSSRYKNWGLLQNASYHLWNMRQRLQKVIDDPTTLLTNDILHEIVWRAFYHASDSVLDMVDCLNVEKNNTAKNKQASRDTTTTAADVTSWGELDDEKGGSDLVFENFLDDQSSVDAVWIRRIVMYTIELLFYQQKWEKLADIILRFNCLSRYQEKWEKLADIILRFNCLSRWRYAESVLPVLAVAQEKILRRAENHGGIAINQPEIVLSGQNGRPSVVTMTPTPLPTNLDALAHIDPRGHDFYSEDNKAFNLISVPVDRDKTLTMIYDNVQQKHCAARALQYSRQLLLRYLSGLCPERKSGNVKVGFFPSDNQAVTALPPNISNEKYEKIEEVFHTPLASSQLGVVITSYDKTIELLQFHGRKALLAQAMSELGNIMLHIGNNKSAHKWWLEVLDIVIMSSSLTSKSNEQCERSYLDVIDIAPSVLLNKRGLWGCMLGAVTSINIARYIHTDDNDKRLQYCFVATSLLKALFSSSLPHPTQCCDFALYDFGKEYNVGRLVPGLNLFSDHFRCDVKTLLSSLVWLSEELIKNGYCIKVLPMLSLARYIASDIFADKKCIFKILLLRVRTLTQAGLFSKAHIALNTLSEGIKLGQKEKASKKQNPGVFYDNKMITNPNNLKAITDLIIFKLTPEVADSYGSQDCGLFVLEQARLLVAIAASVYAIPQNLTTVLQQKLHPLYQIDQSFDLYKPNIEIELFDKNVTPKTVKSFLLAGAQVLLEELRTELLGSERDLREYLDVRGHLFNPSSLHCLVLIELEFASITQQFLDHLNAAKIVFDCMRILEDASILIRNDQKRFGSAWTAFSRSSDLSKTPELLHDDFTPIQSDLDSHMWLACRLKLVKCLSNEDNSVGRIAGFSRTVVAVTGSAQQHCEQGMDEAEVFGKTEIFVEFKWHSLLLRLQHGCFDDNDVKQVKDMMSTLENTKVLSVKGRLLLATLLIYYGDFVTSACDTEQDSISYYKKTESFLKDELTRFGARGTKIIPKNIYLPHVILLAENNLRLCRHKMFPINDLTCEDDLRPVLSALKNALKFALVISCENNPLESELLLLTGKIQRLLFVKGSCISEAEVISTFYDAIKRTYDFDHNLEIMKECYQQLAMFYLTSVESARSGETERTTESVSPTNRKSSPKPSKLARQAKEKKAERKVEKKKELKAAWFSARAVTAITSAIHKRGLLLGDVTALSVSKETGAKIPKNVLHDLLGAISIIADPGEGHIVNDDGVVTMETHINGSNQVAVTWVHLISHVNYLLRQLRYQTLGLEDAGHNGPLYRWHKILKLYQVHQVLQTEVDIYAKTFVGYYPSNVLFLADVALYEKYYDPNYADRNVQEEASDHEVAIHWFFNTMVSTLGPDSDLVHCLYAFNNKPITSGAKSTGMCAGSCSASHKKLLNARKKLRNLRYLAETDLPKRSSSKPIDSTQSNVSSGASSSPRKKKALGSASLRPISSRAASRENVENDLKSCVSVLSNMMKPDRPESKEKLFDTTLKNICTLDSIFDPTSGYVGKVPEPFFNWLLTIFHKT